MLASKFFYKCLLISVCSFVFLGLFIDLPPLMAPDSNTYLNGDIRRTIGYPIFLIVVSWFNSDFALLPYIQGLIYAVSASFLVYNFSRFIENRFVCYFFIICLTMNPIVWVYNAQMLAESLFMSLSMICLGLIISIIFSKKTYMQLSLLGAIIALLVIVRPVGYAYFSVILFILFFIDSNKISAFFRILIPIVFILGAASFKNYMSHGVFATQVFGGYNLLGQVVPIMTQSTLEDKNSKIQDEISKSVANMTKQLPDDLFSWREHFFITAFSYNKGLGDHATPIIFDVYKMKNANQTEKMKLINNIGWDISLNSILSNPKGYSLHVFSNFLGLWYLPTVTSRDELLELQQYLCSDIFSGFFSDQDCNGVLGGVKIPKVAVYLKNLIFSSLFFVSILLIFLFIVKFSAIDKIFALGFFPALMINSHHFLVSLLEAGLSRYALSTWPLIVSLAFFIYIFVNKKINQN